jgi:dienelactone hydrolase
MGFSSVCRAADIASPAPEAGSLAKRRLILEKLQRRLLPLTKSNAFNDFLRRADELPPDFDLMPSQFFLPDPMSWIEQGQARRATLANWPQRRQQIAELTEKWLLGTAPPPPGNVVGEILDKTTVDGQEIWNVRLSFGPNQAAKLGVKLYLPKNKTPSGIFLCDSERYQSWVKKAMDGGFGFAVHSASDGRDQSLAYHELFGDYDWSAFRRRGWSASRVLDWLITLPFVDPAQVYIGGHSRSGKVAMTAAAFDQRFAGVIASSPGSGGSVPYRYCDGYYSGESLEHLTRRFPDWVHQRARLFCGNEDKLPADSHFLYALIAPRPILMSTATEDSVESSWTVEQVYQTIKPVYDLHQLGTNQVLRYRAGGHTITGDETPTAFSNFLLAARRGSPPLSEVIPYRPLHPWDYVAWAARNPVNVLEFPRVNPQASLLPPDLSLTPAARRQQVTEKVQWLLGDKTPYRKVSPNKDISKMSIFTQRHFTKMLDAADGVPPPPPTRRGPPAAKGDAEENEPAPPTRSPAKSNFTATIVTFGDGIPGCLFEPKKEQNRPLVIWLSAFETAQGYSPGHRLTEYSPAALLQAGYPVFTYDPIGTSFRQKERQEFFSKYPDASLMGKMVCDARHAIDAAIELRKSPRPICLYGFAMGGTVAILTAAMDDRVQAIAAVSGFTPLRTDTADRRTGGIARLSHLYGWLPSLGAFIGHEDRIPVDYNEILACIAPRKALLIAPTEDRYAVLGEVRDTVESARQVYKSLGDERGIELLTPFEEIRLTQGMQEQVIDWLGRQFPPGNAR